MIAFSFSEYGERRDDDSLRQCWLESGGLVERLQTASGSAVLYCDVCDRFGPFAHFSDWREGIACKRCKFSARMRASIGFLRRFCKPDAQVYVTEQATALYAWMQSQFSNVQGSEFAHSREQRKALAQYLGRLGGHGDITFQDVTRLTWEDACFDAVLSGDVLEHVPDYRQALSEFGRVLRPDGVLVATFPFTDAEPTIVRARLNALGEVEHLLPAEYHGDPISGGVLCFYHFGWDLLEEVRLAGFREAEMVMPWAPDAGIYYGNWTLIARR
ncbi:hypothetical protein GCM10027431_01120 [Lysobacter rhizosphaerae]